MAFPRIAVRSPRTETKLQDLLYSCAKSQSASVADQTAGQILELVPWELLAGDRSPQRKTEESSGRDQNEYSRRSGLRWDLTCAPGAPWHDYEQPAHVVQFYAEDAFLLDKLSRFAGTALGAGDSAVVIATKAHRDGLVRSGCARAALI